MIEVYMENVEEVEINKKNRKQYGVAMATIGIMALFLMAVFHVPFASVAMTPVADTFGYFYEKGNHITPHLVYYLLKGESVQQAVIDAAKQVGEDLISAINPYIGDIVNAIDQALNGVNWWDWVTGQIESLIIDALATALGIETWELIVAAGGLLWVGW